jgi:hypothetical protein
MTRRILHALTATVLAAAGSVLLAPAAHAAAGVQVEPGTVAAGAATTVRVSGSGFQSVQGGLGGIYVMFGWVDDPAGGSWKPSNGGVTGSGYRYVPDSETAENQGFQKFVAFPGSETAYAANGGQIAADGTWSTEITIPGARFQALDRNEVASEVDCTQVQCGIITIGAHGVRNANNETFTPVSFGATSGGAAAGAAAPGDTAAGSADAAVEAPVVERAPASLGVVQATAVRGRAMTFAAQGFEAGEQVTATLDDGVVSVGPLTAGAHGEIAGVLQLPADLRVGTHVLRLTGAQSGLAPEVDVTVTRDPAEADAAELLAAEAEDDGGVVAGLGWPEIALIVSGTLLAAVVLVSAITAGRRRRAAARDGSAPVAATPASATPAAPAPAAPAVGERTTGAPAPGAASDPAPVPPRPDDRPTAVLPTGGAR